MATYGTRYRCGFVGCTKRYASTDGVRKHARKIHKDWLRDVDDQSTTRDSKIYGSKPSTYCIAETGLLSGLDDDSTHGGSHYDGSVHGENHFGQSDENTCPPPQSPQAAGTSAAAPAACFPGIDNLPSARAVTACLVHQEANTQTHPVDAPFGVPLTGSKRPLESETMGGDSTRRICLKTNQSQDWLATDWDKMGALDIFCDDGRPPPLSLDSGSDERASDPALTPQTAVMRPADSFLACVTPFELSPTGARLMAALPMGAGAIHKTASVMSLERFKEEAGDLDEAEYMAFVSAIFAQ